MQIGDWELLPQRNVLRCDGKTSRLEPRHADLLQFFAAHRGEVVSAEQIIDEVWAGQVVTDQSVYQAVAKLRKAFGDTATNPRYIETVSKRGYRLIADVAIGADPATTSRAMSPIDNAERSTRGFRPLPRRWLAIGILMGAALVLAWTVLRGPPPVAPEQTTTVIAVLPFSVLSSNPDDKLLAAGFAIELAHILGRSAHVRVIGPVSSSWTNSVDQGVDTVGQHIDATIVVSGTLRRSDAGIRVSSALTEVSTGFQLWSEVFDRDDDQIIAVQQDVAAAISDAMDGFLLSPTASAVAPGSIGKTADASTYDSYLLGRYYRHLRTEPDLKRARQYFQTALASDAEYAPALRELAATELMLSFYGNQPLALARAEAERHLTRAMTLEPEAPEGFALLGLSYYLQGKYGLAEELLLRAVTNHPNLHEAWMWLGLTRQEQGRLRDSLAALEYASRLEPLLVTAVVDYAEALLWSGRNDAARGLLENLAAKANASMNNRDQLFRTLSLIERHSGQLAKAFAWSERALEAAPDSGLSLANKVVMLTVLGRGEEARRLANRVYGVSQPGRGTMRFLGRANVSAPGVIDQTMLIAHLTDLQRRPDTPEIEWRLSNFDVGMAAYHEGDLERAVKLLDNSMRGRDFPIARADDDVYACTSLADALARSGKRRAAADQLSQCLADLRLAEGQGWDSLSMMISKVRLAVLTNETDTARRQLSALFERGLRNQPIIANDPVISRLRGSDEYEALKSNMQEAVDTALRSIDLESLRSQ